MPTSVRLDPEMERRLDSLARLTGRSKAYYIREAIGEHIEDLEDVYLAERVRERVRRGEEQVMSADEFWHGLVQLH